MFKVEIRQLQGVGAEAEAILNLTINVPNLNL